MKELNVLALAGRRYCGKTRVAELVAQSDPRFSIRSFAYYLKKEYAEIHGIDVNELYTPRKERHRLGLIDLSKERKRDDGAYFAKKLFDEAKHGEYIVIEDLRFIEELQYCLKFGAAVFKVYAEQHQRKERGWVFDPAVDNDYSETELDLCAHTFQEVTNNRGGVIFNTRDEGYLRIQVLSILHGRFFPKSPREFEYLQGK